MLENSRNRQRGQWSLIGLLLALAIVMILVSIEVPQIAARHSKPGGPRTPIERGYGAACSAYVGQMNQAVTLYKMDHDDQPPTSVYELKRYGVTDDMIHAEGCYFVIDPQSGNVVDRGLSQVHPDAPPPSYASPQPQVSPQIPTNGVPGGADDGDGSGITPNATPQSSQPGPGGIKIPTIPTSGM